VPSEPCSIVFHPEALNDLRRLRGLAPRFLKQLDTLRSNPERGHLLRGSLHPCRSLVLSQRSGGYRAVYLFEVPDNQCTIFAIAEHATVYDKARVRFQRPPESPINGKTLDD
jgi:mRNA-degrading endonuclease RelE of RelBE toxin-antitoxin system